MVLMKSPTGEKPDDPKPPAPQVNDVSAPAAMPPPPDKDPSDLTVHEPSPAAPGPDSADKTDDKSSDKSQDAHKTEKPKPKPPKQPGHHGSGLAIFAALVIVLGLGAMLTYAYLRSQNISVF